MQNPVWNMYIKYINHGYLVTLPQHVIQPENCQNNASIPWVYDPSPAKVWLMKQSYDGKQAC